MTDGDVDDWEDALDRLAEAVEEAKEKEGVGRMKAENRVVGETCEIVANLSTEGELSESDLDQLASYLGDEFETYTKTTAKEEVSKAFTESADGVRFNELLENRLDELEVIRCTDAHQQTLWCWRFEDGVQLEVSASDDGRRKHYAWHMFRADYFDELVSLGKGEKIAPPSEELQESDNWSECIDSLILDHAEESTHVGPRTQAVNLLRDYVESSVAYPDMSHVRKRQGVGVDACEMENVTVLRIPTERVKRVCDRVGITPRGLQAELSARDLTVDGRDRVSDYTYVDSGRVRVPYWALSPDFAEPAEIVPEPISPAEQVRQARSDGGETDEAGGDVDGGEPGLRNSRGTRGEDA